MENNRNKENLNELFEQFFNKKDAKEAVEDIRAGEKILRENPAHEPCEELIAGIKSEIGSSLLQRRARILRRIVYKAAVAAALIIISTIAISLFEQDLGNVRAEIIPREIWDSEDIMADDLNLAYFVTEIQQIEDDMLAIESGEYGGISDYEVDNLEMELIAIDTDFWKG